MALAHPRGAHAPRLVDEVRRLVVPVRPHRELGRHARQHRALLLLEEEAAHHRVEAGRGAREDRRARRGRDGQQVGVAHPAPGRLAHRLPGLARIAALIEVGARLPVAAVKERVAPALGGKPGARGDGVAVDALEHLVGKGQVLLALPLDAALGQHVVVARDAQADRAVAAVGDLGVGQGVEVEVDDVVERAHHGLDHFAHLALVLHRQVPERQAREVADHEVARAGLGDHHRVAVLGLDLGRHALDLAHVLRDLGAEVGAVDHACVRIGVGAVHRVAHEGERRARLHGALEHEAYDVLDAHGALGDARVGHALLVAALPLLAKVVLEGVALHGEDVVRAHEVPGLVEILLGHLPEQVGVADGREDVVRLHAVVSVVGAQLQELGQVAVPGIEVDGHGALAHAQLVHGHGGVVDDADPTDHAAGRALEAAYAPALGANLAQVHAHAAAVLGDLGEVVDAAVDPLQAVGHGVDETARELVEGLARVGQRGRGHGDLEARQHVVEAAHPREANGRGGLGAGGGDVRGAGLVLALVHGEVERDAEEHLLRALERLVTVRADDVALEEKVEARVGEQVVALGHHEAGGLVDLGFAVVAEDKVAVEALVGEVAQLLVEVGDAAGGLGGGEPAVEGEGEQAGGHHLPARGLLARELHGGLGERAEALVGAHAALHEAAGLGQKGGEGVVLLGEVALDALEDGVELVGAGGGADGLTREAGLGARVAVEDVALGHVEVALLHEGALDDVLDVLHGRDAALGHGGLDGREQGGERLGRGGLASGLGRNLGKRPVDGRGDLRSIVGLRVAVTLGYVHVVSASRVV